MAFDHLSDAIQQDIIQRTGCANLEAFKLTRYYPVFNSITQEQAQQFNLVGGQLLDADKKIKADAPHRQFIDSLKGDNHNPLRLPLITQKWQQLIPGQIAAELTNKLKQLFAQRAFELLTATWPAERTEALLALVKTQSVSDYFKAKFATFTTLDECKAYLATCDGDNAENTINDLLANVHNDVPVASQLSNDNKLTIKEHYKKQLSAEKIYREIISKSYVDAHQNSAIVLQHYIKTDDGKKALMAALKTKVDAGEANIANSFNAVITAYQGNAANAQADAVAAAHGWFAPDIARRLYSERLHAHAVEKAEQYPVLKQHIVQYQKRFIEQTARAQDINNTLDIDRVLDFVINAQSEEIFCTNLQKLGLTDRAQFTKESTGLYAEIAIHDLSMYRMDDMPLLDVGLFPDYFHAENRSKSLEQLQHAIESNPRPWMSIWQAFKGAGDDHHNTLLLAEKLYDFCPALRQDTRLHSPRAQLEQIKQPLWRRMVEHALKAGRAVEISAIQLSAININQAVFNPADGRFSAEVLAERFNDNALSAITAEDVEFIQLDLARYHTLQARLDNAAHPELCRLYQLLAQMGYLAIAPNALANVSFEDIYQAIVDRNDPEKLSFSKQLKHAMNAHLHANLREHALPMTAELNQQLDAVANEFAHFRVAAIRPQLTVAVRHIDTSHMKAAVEAITKANSTREYSKFHDQTTLLRGIAGVDKQGNIDTQFNRLAIPTKGNIDRFERLKKSNLTLDLVRDRIRDTNILVEQVKQLKDALEQKQISKTDWKERYARSTQLNKLNAIEKRLTTLQTYLDNLKFWRDVIIPSLTAANDAREKNSQQKKYSYYFPEADHVEWIRAEEDSGVTRAKIKSRLDALQRFPDNDTQVEFFRGEAPLHHNVGGEKQRDKIVNPSERNGDLILVTIADAKDAKNVGSFTYAPHSQQGKVAVHHVPADDENLMRQAWLQARTIIKSYQGSSPSETDPIRVSINSDKATRARNEKLIRYTYYALVALDPAFEKAFIMPASMQKAKTKLLLVFRDPDFKSFLKASGGEEQRKSFSKEHLTDVSTEKEGAALGKVLEQVAKQPIDTQDIPRSPMLLNG